MKIFKKVKKGFTLVELVVVIAVIAILAAVSVGAYFGVTESANRSRLEQEAKQAYSNIQLVSLVDSNDSFDLDINGLHINDELSEFDKVLDNAGVDYELRDNSSSISQDKPTIIFSTERVQSQNTNKLYKQFDFYITEISGMHANCDIINGGKITVVKADNPAFGESETPDIEDPIIPEPTPSVDLGDDFEITAGQSGTITSTVVPANDTLTWTVEGTGLSIDNGNYVSESGKYDVNTVTVRAESSKGASDEVVITINPDTEASLTLPADFEITAGQSGTIQAIVNPSTDTVTWEVISGSGLTIDQDGSYVTESGKYDDAEVVVRVTSSRGKFDEVKITIKADSQPSISFTSDSYTIQAGSAGNLPSPIVTPVNDTYEFSLVSGEGLTINADGSYVAAGGKYDDSEAVAKVVSSRGAEATLNITIEADAEPSIEIPSTITVTAGHGGTIAANVQPANDTVTFTVVSGEGLTFVENGTFTTTEGKYETSIVVVKATSGRGAEATCTVTINPDLTPSVQFAQDTLVISAGDEGQLAATATPASDTSLIRYSSNNEDVLLIDESTGEYLSDDSLTETTVVIVTVTTRENISDTIEITINPKAPAVRNFGLAYSKEQIMDGSKIIIVHNTEKIAMGASTETYPDKMPVIANDLIGNNNISITDGTLDYFTVDLSDDGSKFTLQAQDGRYLYRKGNSGTNMSLQNEQTFINNSEEDCYWFKVTFVENSFDVKIETLHDSNRFINYNGSEFGLYDGSYSTRIYVENLEVSGQLTDFDYIVDPNKTEYEVGSTFTISYKDGSAQPFFAGIPTLSLSSVNDAVTISGNKVTCNKEANDVEITISAGEINKTFKFNIIEKPAVSESFKKVTSAPADWSGTYLIVYESGKVAFNGGLSTLDASSNTIPVTISNSTIVADATTKAAQFVITKSGSYYNIKSASGYFIGRDATSNGLNSSKTTNYNNTISMSGSVISIKGKGECVLKFNDTSGQNRFRYYASGQKAITLYKLS